jgi:putative tryptophan/tyrosine transport system substrate-binding protein
MAIDIGRREFISVLGGTAAAWPLAARAQKTAMPVIGFLSSASPDGFAPLLFAFREGLNQTGYVEGRNLTIEFGWANGQYDRLPTLASNLVQRQVAVLVAGGGAVAALAAKSATQIIPILFVIGDDPIKYGLVASLNQPGGNITGMTLFISALMAKRLQLLSELMPSKSAIAALVNPKNPNAESEAREIEVAARAARRELNVFNASSESAIDAAFESLAKQGVGGLLIGTDTFFFSQRDRIIALATRHAVPAFYFAREFAAAGGLMSYGPSFTGEWRQAGIYAGRILRGVNPADLPVTQPTRFELVINLKTAKALGLDIPPKLLALTDEVIE